MRHCRKRFPTSFAKFVKMFVGGVAVNSEERVVFKLFHCCKILVVAWHYAHGDGHCLRRALDFIGISVLSRMLAAYMEGIVIGIVKLCGGCALYWQNRTYRQPCHCFLRQSWFIFHKFSLKNFENKGEHCIFAVEKYVDSAETLSSFVIALSVRFT